MATRTTFDDDEKAAFIKALGNDFTAKNLKKVAEKKGTTVQNLRNWCIKEGHITPTRRGSSKKSSAPILITSVMLDELAEKMKPHTKKEAALATLKGKVEAKQAELDKLQADYAAKEKELLKIQIEIQKEIGMI